MVVGLSSEEGLVSTPGDELYVVYIWEKVSQCLLMRVVCVTFFVREELCFRRPVFEPYL